jgi:hypothetical protein
VVYIATGLNVFLGLDNRRTQFLQKELQMVEQSRPNRMTTLWPDSVFDRYYAEHLDEVDWRKPKPGIWPTGETEPVTDQSELWGGDNSSGN